MKKRLIVGCPYSHIKKTRVLRKPNDQITVSAIMENIFSLEALGHWDEEDEILMLDKDSDKEK